MTRLEHTRTALRNDDGFSLPEVLISVMVNAACMAIIAASLVTFSVLQQQVAFRTASTNDTAVIEAQWRKSGQSATDVRAVSDTEVTFTRPSTDGDGCARVTFMLTPAGTTRELAVTRELFPGAPDATTGECTGTPGERMLIAQSADVGVTASFQYRTAVGRPTTFAGGEQAPVGAGVQPADITTAAWESETLGSASITLNLGSLSGSTRSSRVVQILPALASESEPITTTRFVTP
jgi:Tfp pilus assembly protein PilV